MGVLQDIFNIWNSTKSPDFDLADIIGDEASPVGAAASYDSIAKQAKHGVMEFPFLASRSLSFENIQMVSKASERNFASFLQVIFTMNQVTDSDNPIDFVRQYHQNQSSTINGPSDVLQFVFNSDISPAMRNQIMRDVREGLVTFEEMFELNSLNSKYIPKDVKITVSMEAKKAAAPKWNPRQDGEKNLPKNIFVDNDVKKANEMIPTLMHVRILRKAGQNDEASQFIDFIVGVKAVIHPMDSSDMINHIVAIFQERGLVFKLITWTTGEISLIKDLILRVNDVKGEIGDFRSGQSSKWWSALKNMKAKRRLNKVTRRDPMLPNASLVLSMEEVDYIKANYGFDVLEDKSGRKIIDELSILQLTVVDAAAEIVYNFTDGSEHWELVTFKGLEKENGSSERQFKEMLKAVNRLN